MVSTTLVPMATAGVVHSDIIRAGWTETANIFEQTKTDRTRTLSLVDFESVCKISSTPADDTGRTFQISYDSQTTSAQYAALQYRASIRVVAGYLRPLHMDISNWCQFGRWLRCFCRHLWQRCDLGRHFWELSTSRVPTNRPSSIFSKFWEHL